MIASMDRQYSIVQSQMLHPLQELLEFPQAIHIPCKGPDHVCLSYAGQRTERNYHERTDWQTLLARHVATAIRSCSSTGDDHVKVVEDEVRTGCGGATSYLDHYEWRREIWSIWLV